MNIIIDVAPQIASEIRVLELPNWNYVKGLPSAFPVEEGGAMSLAIQTSKGCAPSYHVRERKSTYISGESREGILVSSREASWNPCSSKRPGT
jgi:hypothetical protein